MPQVKPRSRRVPESSERDNNSTWEDMEFEPRRSSRLKNSESPNQVTPREEQPSRTETLSRRKIIDDQPSKKKSRPARARIEDYDDEYLNSPMNEVERSEWKGWCEIESDPVSSITLRLSP